MLYGFMGFQPRPDGFAIRPRLPKDWPELTITQIALHRHVLDLKATREGTVTVSGTGPANATLAVEAPPGVRVAGAGGISVGQRGTAD